MNHKIFKTLLAAVIATMTFCAEADIHTETVNGIEWNYSVENGKASLEDGYFSLTIPKSTSGAITIPSTLGGYPVTSIGDRAFYECSSLKSVTIPNSVTSIGDWAFSSCKSLKSVTIPNSVTNIGFEAFCGCSSLTSVTIPNSVTDIGSYVFSGCHLKEVTVPGWKCGIDFSSVTNLVISDGVKCIGKGVFSGSKSLTRVIIPNSVTNIGDSAFYDCWSLTSVTIPNSVTSIGDRAFLGCWSLTSVTIPNSVRSIGDSTFEGCSSLKSVTIPNSVTSIGEGAFSVCKSLKSVTIPNSVTSIGDWAFSSCKSLKSVTIPNSVTNIGKWAFEGCGELTFYTDNGNRDHLRRMLRSSGANIKEIIAQDGDGLGWIAFPCGLVFVVGVAIFWIVQRKKKKEGTCDKAKLNENGCLKKDKWWSPSGRATRSKWWLSRLVISLIAMLLIVVLKMDIQPLSENNIIELKVLFAIIPFLQVLFIFSAVYISIIFDIKRFHDINLSGWTLLLVYSLVWMLTVGFGVGFGSVVSLLLGVFDGTRGPNRYGEDPKRRV